MPRHPDTSRAVTQIRGSIFTALAEKLRAFKGEVYPLHVGDTWLEPVEGWPHGGPRTRRASRHAPLLAARRACRAGRRAGRARHAPTGVARERTSVLVTGRRDRRAGDAIGRDRPARATRCCCSRRYWPLIEASCARFTACRSTVPFYGRVARPESAIERRRGAALRAHACALYLNTPNNPSGRVIAARVARGDRRLGRAARPLADRRRGLRGPGLPGEHTSRRSLAPERTFSAHSFSKAYGDGRQPLRLRASARRRRWRSCARCPPTPSTPRRRRRSSPRCDLLEHRAGARLARRRARLLPRDGRLRGGAVRRPAAGGSTFLFLDVAPHLDQRGLQGFLARLRRARRASSRPARASAPIRPTSGSASPRRRPTSRGAGSTCWRAAWVGSRTSARIRPFGAATRSVLRNSRIHMQLMESRSAPRSRRRSATYSGARVSGGDTFIVERTASPIARLTPSRQRRGATAREGPSRLRQAACADPSRSRPRTDQSAPTPAREPVGLVLDTSALIALERPKVGLEEASGNARVGARSRSIPRSSTPSAGRRPARRDQEPERTDAEPASRRVARVARWRSSIARSRNAGPPVRRAEPEDKLIPATTSAVAAERQRPRRTNVVCPDGEEHFARVRGLRRRVDPELNRRRTYKRRGGPSPGSACSLAPPARGRSRRARAQARRRRSRPPDPRGRSRSSGRSCAGCRDASAVAHCTARSSSPRRGGNGWRPATTRMRIGAVRLQLSAGTASRRGSIVRGRVCEVSRRGPGASCRTTAGPAPRGSGG